MRSGSRAATVRPPAAKAVAAREPKTGGDIVNKIRGQGGAEAPPRRQRRKRVGGRLRRPDLKDMPGVVVAYRGLSPYNGRPILAVVYCVKYTSGDTKLGDMCQLAIYVDGMSPAEAARTGEDVAVCDACPLRPSPGGHGICYVVLPSHIRRPWEMSCGKPADLAAACEAIGRAGVPFRLGSYGNASAMPLGVVEVLVAAAKSDHTSARHTGYIRDWDRADQRFSKYVMASVLSPEERVRAKALGYRTFRIKGPDEPVGQGEILCPASLAKGRVTCASCLLCSGTDGRGTMDIAIDIHGSGNKDRKYFELREKIARREAELTKPGN